MKNLNNQFFSLTKSFGSDIELVQGAGGNSSIKSSDRDYFLVKGSGTWMKDALKKDIFLNVDGKNIYDDFLNDTMLPLEQYSKSSIHKPSIETLLHAIIPHKYVFHLHCLRSISLSSSSNAKSNLENLFNFPFCIVDYISPGIELASAILESCANKQYPSVYFLRNHGLILASDNLSDISRYVEEIKSKVQPREIKNRNTNKALPNFDDFCCPQDNLIQSLAFNELALSIYKKGILYPDHAVFLGSSIPIYKEIKSNDVKNLDYFILENQGVFVKENLSDIKISMIHSLCALAPFLLDEEYDYIPHTQIQALMIRPDEIQRRSVN